MKNLSGLLYVLTWCLMAMLVITIFVAAALLVYTVLGFLVFLVMAKSYIILGKIWFFIVWPVLIAVAIGYQLYKHFRKKI